MVSPSKVGTLHFSISIERVRVTFEETVLEAPVVGADLARFSSIVKIKFSCSKQNFSKSLTTVLMSVCADDSTIPLARSRKSLLSLFLTSATMFEKIVCELLGIESTPVSFTSCCIRSSSEALNVVIFSF